MCCHRVISISLLQSALSPSRRRRVQDDDSTNANVVHRPQQVVLITDEEERGMPMVLDHQFIDQPMHLLPRQPTPPPRHTAGIVGRPSIEGRHHSMLRSRG